MSSYVFRDSARTITVQRTNAYKESKDQRFYCPNFECDAHLYRCDADGVNSSYFRATYPEHIHISGCPFSKTQSVNSPEQFNENSFNPDQLLESMSKRSGSKNLNKQQDSNRKNVNNDEANIECKKDIRTIKQLHDVFSSLSIREKYANIEVQKLLLDQRSANSPLYSKGLFYTKLVEAKIRKSGKHFCNERKAIYLETAARASFYRKSENELSPLSSIQPLILELKFNSTKTYKETLAVFQNFNFNKNPKLKEEMQEWLILVYGKWGYRQGNYYEYCDWNEAKKDRCFTTDINSKSQYRIPPIKVKKE